MGSRQLDPMEDHKHRDQTSMGKGVKESMIYKFIRYAIILSLAICMTFFVGIKTEERRVAIAKSTRSKYTSNCVCSRYRSKESEYCTDSGNGDSGRGNSTQCSLPSKYEFVTTNNKEEAINAGHDIVHCGECGRCSTQNDIDLMINTKETLTEDATVCALRGLFMGDSTMDACLRDIGFTPSCSVSICLGRV